jgi:hypothetical protein
VVGQDLERYLVVRNELVRNELVRNFLERSQLDRPQLGIKPVEKTVNKRNPPFRAGCLVGPAGFESATLSLSGTIGQLRDRGLLSKKACTSARSSVVMSCRCEAVSVGSRTTRGLPRRRGCDQSSRIC